MKAIVTFALLALFAITGEAVETHWNFLSVVSYGSDCHHLVSDFSGFEMCVDVYGSSLGICDHSSSGGGIVALGKEGSTVTTGTIPQGQLSITAPLNFDKPFFVIFQVNATDLPDKPTLYGWADLTVNTDHSVTINRSAITDADSIVVGAIPEPTSGLLLLIGAALLALRRRRGL